MFRVIGVMLLTLLCDSLFLDACEWFITTVDFASRIKSLSTAQHLITNEVVAFSLRLAGHLAGVLGPMPVGNQQFADAVDTLFDKVLEAEIWWNRASVRAAWLAGLRYALGDGHANNRRWLSAHGKIFADSLSHILIVLT